MQSMPKVSSVPINGTDLTNDPKAELGKLKEMLDSGLITQQDYEKKKTNILAKM
jgi:Short C-terminal domain